MNPVVGVTPMMLLVLSLRGWNRHDLCVPPGAGIAGFTANTASKQDFQVLSFALRMQILLLGRVSSRRLLSSGAKSPEGLQHHLYRFVC